MRADDHTLSALNADVWVPNGNFTGQVALFPSRCAGREGSISRKRAHGHLIAAASDQFGENVSHKGRRFFRDRRLDLDVAANMVWNSHLEEPRERLIDSIQIHLHDFLALLAVGFANRGFDRSDGFVVRKHA